ncbi:hypothetical protein IFM89_038624 [Coptis chinensis]|uniref:COMM domain-containing protein n=1 Tax=Coptis chinensis TaxID=261450 RepID=A0A835HN33_9MAGN|nr:hypothetical protein IFM89_038624 [Coptis chinensis]
MMDHSLWGHLPLLVRSTSKESVEYILQTLWRTRKTGLDATDRDTLRGLLQLPNDSDLDPLLVCLRVLIRKCVCVNNNNKDEIQKLFPQEVSPELQRLLTLLLQKFQKEWRDDKDQLTIPRLKTMTWNLANQETELTQPLAIINFKLHDDAQPNAGETEVKIQFDKDDLETMVKSMYCIRDQFSDMVKFINQSVLIEVMMRPLTGAVNPRKQLHYSFSGSNTKRYDIYSWRCVHCRIVSLESQLDLQGRTYLCGQKPFRVRVIHTSLLHALICVELGASYMVMIVVMMGTKYLKMLVEYGYIPQSFFCSPVTSLDMLKELQSLFSFTYTEGIEHMQCEEIVFPNFIE